jgi:hypothetical protein
MVDWHAGVHEAVLRMLRKAAYILPGRRTVAHGLWLIHRAVDIGPRGSAMHRAIGRRVSLAVNLGRLR